MQFYFYWTPSVIYDRAEPSQTVHTSEHAFKSCAIHHNDIAIFALDTSNILNVEISIIVGCRTALVHSIHIIEGSMKKQRCS